MPHIVFPAEPHRATFCHVRVEGGWLPCRVQSVDRAHGTVALSGMRYGDQLEATYTVDPDEAASW